MKKLLLLAAISCFSASLFGYTVKIINGTGGAIKVGLDMVARPDYIKERLEPQQTWTQDTVGWCIRGIYAWGIDGSVMGIPKHYEETPGIDCKGYILTINENINKRFRDTDPMTGKEMWRFSDFVFNWEGYNT